MEKYTVKDVKNLQTEFLKQLEKYEKYAIKKTKVTSTQLLQEKKALIKPYQKRLQELEKAKTAAVQQLNDEIKKLKKIIVQLEKDFGGKRRRKSASGNRE